MDMIKVKVKIALVLFVILWAAAFVQIAANDVLNDNRGITEACSAASYKKVSGHVDSAYSYNNSIEIAEKIMKYFSADIVSVHTGDVCTVYGYTDDIREYVISNGKKINIQVSCSADEPDDTTQINVGTPILNGSY